MTAMGFVASARRAADSTPSDRKRVVDLLRGASILVVVFGHWLMAAVTIEGGELSAGHLLILADWTHPLTWVLQVMPIFFLSGALYPLTNLPPALAAATRIDPLSYGIDGLRGTLIGLSEIGLATDAIVLVVVASLFMWLGAWSFSRIQG